MRKLNQLVALTAALLFAGQSALADVSCSMMPNSSAAPVPACCAMAPAAPGHHVAPSCHETMPSEPAAAQCSQSGCSMANVQAAAAAIKSPRLRAETTLTLVATQELPAPSAEMHPQSSTSVSVPATARYILFRAFRI